jgi:hypothetical protein
MRNFHTSFAGENLMHDVENAIGLYEEWLSPIELRHRLLSKPWFEKSFYLWNKNFKDLLETDPFADTQEIELIIHWHTFKFIYDKKKNSNGYYDYICTDPQEENHLGYILNDVTYLAIIGSLQEENLWPIQISDYVLLSEHINR